jgi:uroporphyrinogen III methyltransferase/synthase
VTVYLVGAGPGDPGLLTIKGRDLLAEADVVLYDDLVDARVLGLCGERAVRVGVGKARGAGGHRPATAQEEINRLLVEHGRSGARVVRLKGGDPFVFGRGGEEALALAAAGVPYEVVPGVSSAVAAPAYAGIPVTQRGLASSVTIVTGHEAPDKAPDAARVDWRRLGGSGGDTLVILMGVGRLPHIAAELIAGGRAPETPAAVIERGTTPEQRVVTGTLRDLPQLAAEAGVKSPACIVVGEVAALRRDLAWFDQPAQGPVEVTVQCA